MTSKFYRSNLMFKVLKEQEIEDIFFANLDILERVGVKVYDEEAVKIYKDNGCIVEDKNTVHISPGLVKSSLSSVPERISIYNRLGELAMILEGRRSYFGTGSDCPNFIDPYTGKRRRSNNADVINSATVSDYLSEIDFHMSLAIAADSPVDHYYVYEYALMTENTIKPLIVTAINKQDLEKIHEIASVVSGSKENFKLKPTFVLYNEPNNPLYHTKESLQKLIYSSKNRIPFIYSSGAMAGATSPVTKAGTLVTTVCESISGIVLSQLINPGTPVILGGGVAILDMATSVKPFGSPELLVMQTALTEIAHYLKIPVFSKAGCSDSKILDNQAAIEATDSIMMAALSGGNLIHDVGYIESGLTGCLEMVVMSNEIISKVKYISQGIEVSEDTLLRDVICNVGPCGNYIEEDSTLKLFKKEFYFSDMFSRDNYERWTQKGSKTFDKLLNEKVIDILKNHKPPKLNESIKKEIDKILAECR